MKQSYPVLSVSDVKTSKILLVVVVALHAGLAIAIKILFFAHASPARKAAPPAKQPDEAGEGGTQGLMRMFLGL